MRIIKKIKNIIKKINHFIKGFTLIETLVTIAIIGILGSISMVTLSNARHEAEAAVTKKAFKTLSTAISICSLNQNYDLLIIPGVEMCSPPIGALLPTAIELKSETANYEIDTLASGEKFYKVTLIGHKKSNYNNMWEISENEIKLLEEEEEEEETPSLPPPLPPPPPPEPTQP